MSEKECQAAAGCSVSLRFPVTVLFAAALVLCNMTAAIAQPILTLKRVVSNWPQIELYYSVGCAGTPVWNLTPADIRVYDNGEEVTQFALQCPDPTTVCPMSTALVFDASGSMAGAGNTGMIQAGKTFVGAMDGNSDEAAVIWFNQNVVVEQAFTSDTTLLNAAIDRIPASGATAFWDGVATGLNQIIVNASNSCRAVVAITDGMDNSSTVFLAEIVELAVRNHIRIFTIALGSGVNSTELEQVAILTGGRFYQLSSTALLNATYTEIASIIHQGFLECSLTYTQDCPDGSLHTVGMHLQNVCGGNDVASKSYRAPMDSTVWSTLPLLLPDVVTEGGEDFVVPLILPSALNGEILTSLSFDLCYNSHQFEFLGVEILPGSLLDGMMVTATSIHCGMRVQTSGTKPVFGSGELLQLKFRSLQVPMDTMAADLTVTSAAFESGCLKPWINTSTVTVLPGRVALFCDLDAPRQLVWDNTTDTYTPDPVVVRFRVFNAGTIPSTGGSATISLDTTVFRPVTPTAVQRAIADISAGDYVELTWQLTALPKAHADSSLITVSASFSNHNSIDGSIRVHFNRSEPILVCELELPVLTGDTVAMRYDPNPFPVRITVRNIGVVPADSVYAAIEIPTEMALAGVDLNGPWVKPISLFQLHPGQSGSAEWQVYHPLIPAPHSDTVRMHTWATEGGMRLCDNLIDIPAIAGPILFPTCDVPDTLRFDPVSGGYTPNPFTVQLSCVNRGSAPAFDVSATLQLPPGVELSPAVQPLTRSLHTAPMYPWSIGDPIPQVSWTVRLTKGTAQPGDLPFAFTVSAQKVTGSPLTDVITGCSVNVPELVKSATCSISLPDSLRIDASGRNLEPNPVPVHYLVRNTGEREIRLTNVALDFSFDGITLSASSPIGLDSLIDVMLLPGDSVVFDWLLDVRNRSYPRTTQCTVTVLDADGDPHQCIDHLYIPAIIGQITCSMSADSLLADYTAQQYTPMPFTVRVDAVNNKAELTDSIWARIILPAGGLALAGADVGLATKPLSPGRLFPQQQGFTQWLLEHPLTNQDIHYTVETMLWEAGGDTTYCDNDVFVPRMPAPFWFTLSASGPVAFCEGGSLRLEAGVGYSSYLWSTGDTTHAITVDQSGSYSCAVIAADGTPGLSQQVIVTVYLPPAKPVISRSGDVLSTDPSAAWQWYLDGSAIAGANTQSFALNLIGNYQVRIIDTNGCEALSDIYVVNILDVDAEQAVGQRFALYPNPVDGVLHIDISLERPAAVRLTLRDILGRELLHRERPAGIRSFTEQFNVRDLQPGVYILEFEAGMERRSKVVTIR